MSQLNGMFKLNFKEREAFFTHKIDTLRHSNCLETSCFRFFQLVRYLKLRESVLQTATEYIYYHSSNSHMITNSFDRMLNKLLTLSCNQTFINFIELLRDQFTTRAHEQRINILPLLAFIPKSYLMEDN